MATSTNVALCQVEAFGRHGMAATLDPSLLGAFRLAASSIRVKVATCRQENAGGAMADGCARSTRRVGVTTAPRGSAARMLGSLWTPLFASGGPTLINAITGRDAKPLMGFYAGHCPEPF
jgi:hypothetical protein